MLSSVFQSLNWQKQQPDFIQQNIVTGIKNASVKGQNVHLQPCTPQMCDDEKRKIT